MKTVSLVFEETMAQVSPEDGSHEASAAAANRARSNTWSVGCQPMITAFEAAEDERMVLTALNCSSAEADSSGTSPVPGNKDPATTNFRKNWTRRNAWGNLSYAELITKAIESSPEKRLTLSQIYDWIVHNVDYFANKGDNSSSAGWKNSIRHNLSLHSRFVRLVNDGAGKSSWWSINPDAQPLKPSRRRAATLDSKTLRKRTGLEAGANRKLDFAGRSLEEVDSTTSGPVFSSPSILSPRNSSPDEVTAMDIGEGSPSRYSRERGFVKAGSLSNTVPGDVRIVGETGGRSGSGTPPYGVPRDGFRMDLFGGKGPGQDPELCFPSSENPSVHGTGQVNGGGARVAHAKQRRYAPAPLEDRSISVGGFCAGSGNFYDDVFDPHPVPPGNGYFPKRYYDETGCYTPRLDYGECRSNSFCQDDAYTGGFYGNGGCFSNRTFPGDRYAGESGSVPVQGMGRGPMEVRGGGQANGQGLRAGGFPEVSGVDQNGSRSSDGSTGDENRNLNAFPIARYCASYVDMEGGKGTGGGYDAFQGTYRHDDDCFRDEGGLQRIPSVPRFQDGEHKTESSLTDANFFRALTTMSGYSEEDFPSNPDTLRPISSSPGLPSSQESFYRSSAGGNKYPYLSDPTAKPFSQLLANRATYPTCRNASTVEGFYIPTTF